MEVSKATLDGAWSNLGLVGGVPSCGRGWNCLIFKVPSHPNDSVIPIHNSQKNIIIVGDRIIPLPTFLLQST